AQYLQCYGDLMLNVDMEVCTVAELVHRPYLPERRLFIRPNDDFKDIAGQTMTFAEYQAWASNLKDTTETKMTLHSELAISSPKEIRAEWRLFIVDRRVVAASQYRPADAASGFAPPEVNEFGERAAALWSPAPVFVMDVARTSDGLKIIELNCFN